MEFVILVIAAVVVTGLLYWKVPAVKNFIDSKLSKKDEPKPIQTAELLKPVNPGITVPTVNPFIAWKRDGWTISDIYRWKQGQGQSASFSPEEMDQARAAGYLVDAKPVEGSIDRSGFDLGEGMGLYRDNAIPDNEDRTFTYTIRPGMKETQIIVFGLSGTQLNWVRDGYYEGGVISRHVQNVPNIPGPHSYTVQVRSIGGRIGVQFHQA